jgi:hypothetical protein
MVKNSDLVRNLENQYLANTPIDYENNLKIFEALWQEAQELGALQELSEITREASSFRIARFLNPLPLV